QSLCYFVYARYADPRNLHSFPTRRSSDLDGLARLELERDPVHVVALEREHLVELFGAAPVGQLGAVEQHDAAGQPLGALARAARSEEHTSELQSRENLVCRLLLEKKNIMA